MRTIIAALLLLAVGCYSESPETRYHNMTQIVNQLDADIREVARLSIGYRQLVDKCVLDALKTGDTTNFTEKQLDDYKTIKNMDSLLEELSARKKEMLNKMARINL